MLARRSATRLARFVKEAEFSSKTFSRSCFIPLYGTCRPPVHSLPKYQHPLSNPNMQNQQVISRDKKVPADRLDFPNTLSPVEIRVVELTKYNRLNEMMYLFKKESNAISHSTVVAQAARALARQGRTEDIKSLVDMAELKTVPDLKPMLFYSNVVEGNVEGAKELLTTLRENGTFIAPSHQQEFLKLVTKDATADEMVKIAKEFDIVPSLALHDTYVDALLENDQIDMANEYLNFMRSLGTEPDNRILNKFIFYYVEKGELQAAEDVLVC